MRVRVIAVGKLKEKYFTDAVAEYVKRLGRFAKVECVQIADRRIPEHASRAQEEQVLAQEGGDILDKIGPQAYVVALCVEGKKLDSVAFSKKLSALATAGRSDVTFVIGGSLGLSGRGEAARRFAPQLFGHDLSAPAYARHFARAGVPRV